MPKRKRYLNNARKIKITLLCILGVAILIIIGILGVKELQKNTKIQQERSVLSKTLKDVTKLYDNFKDTTDTYQQEVVQEPENKCTEISSKSPDPDYTCGTRGEVRFIESNEMAFTDLSNELEKAINAKVFEIKQVYPVSESSLYNGLTMQINMMHRETGRVCSIDGHFLRVIESFTDKPRLSVYSFNCSLNTSEKIFPEEAS